MGTTTGFLGRVLIALIFVGSGVNKITTYQDKGGPMVGYLRSHMEPALSKFTAATGVNVAIDKSMYPHILLAAAVVEVLGSLLFVAGMDLGALLLLGFLIPTSVIMHNFWDLPAGMEQQNEMVHFLKNVAIMGALLVFLGRSRGNERRQPVKDKYL